ncbi:MAG: hypothetical protein DRO99_03050, partial [Candidatus Aenigmatarchaeota archaeon]
IGMMKMKDNGKQDNKLLCVAANDPNFSEVMSIKDITKGTLEEIEHFFDIYKKIGTKRSGSKGLTRVQGWEGADKAKKELLYCMKLYEKVKASGNRQF